MLRCGRDAQHPPDARRRLAEAGCAGACAAANPDCGVWPRRVRVAASDLAHPSRHGLLGCASAGVQHGGLRADASVVFRCTWMGGAEIISRDALCLRLVLVPDRRDGAELRPRRFRHDLPDPRRRLRAGGRRGVAVPALPADRLRRGEYVPDPDVLPAHSPAGRDHGAGHGGNVRRGRGDGAGAAAGHGRRAAGRSAESRRPARHHCAGRDRHHRAGSRLQCRASTAAQFYGAL